MNEYDHKGRLNGDCPVLTSLMDEIKQLKKKVRKLKKKLAIL
jgi:hypothetical protein